MATPRRGRRVLTALALFWGAVATWVLTNMEARDVSRSASASDDAVSVASEDGAVTFSPTADTAAAGLVFYPGALVDPEAYAPLARAVAEAGYPVVVAPLAFRLAPLGRHRADLDRRTLAAIGSAPEGRRWVVGGHSRGGKLAAEFARRHEPSVAGLLLIGTSHPRETDLSGLRLDVTKVFGSEDGLASEAEVRAFAPNLPDATRWVRVEGANHAQFGWYGRQVGDRRATISREAQHEATVRAVLDQLRRVSGERTGRPSGDRSTRRRPPVRPRRRRAG